MDIKRGHRAWGVQRITPGGIRCIKHSTTTPHPHSAPRHGRGRVNNAQCTVCPLLLCTVHFASKCHTQIKLSPRANNANFNRGRGLPTPMADCCCCSCSFLSLFVFLAAPSMRMSLPLSLPVLVGKGLGVMGMELWHVDVRRM
jgi:hypothetical protein